MNPIGRSYTSRMIFENKLQMLAGAVYQEECPIDGWRTRELLYTKPVCFEEREPWRPISVGDRWTAALDITRIFETRVTIPASFAGKQAVLLLDTGGEGQVKIDGELISALLSDRTALGAPPDRMRCRVYVPEKFKPGDTFTLEIEACLNFFECFHGGTCEDSVQYTFRKASIAVLDEAIEQYYFDLRCALDALDTQANPMDTLTHSNARILNPEVQNIMLKMDGDSYMYNKLFDAILASTTCLELHFDHERLLRSVEKASAVLEREIGSLPRSSAANITFVGQAHIDTAWLWPIRESVRKCAKTFTNVLSLMDRYPDFIFAFSQPQLFAYLEEFYPEVFEKVKARVAEGRIELVGNAWVEMDTNVPSGEALVRQLLYGRQYYLEKFGKASSVFWMPDVFGYSWALPQIMKRSGVDYFFTSKLVNNDTNNFPHSLFMWQGVDGTRILSYLQRLNYNGMLCASTMTTLYGLFNQKDVSDELLMTIGYGDGGGGPSYQMLENAKRLKNFPGLPSSRFETADTFFRDVEPLSPALPVWNDEMYYEFHRGTYTSQADVKKNNRKGELLLRRAEIAATMASALLGKDYPGEQIAALYKDFLTNQFHDILPGSSIHAVYEDCRESYAKVLQGGEKLFEEALGALTAAQGAGKNQFCVWNFLSWPRSGEAEIALPGEFSGLSDEDGNAVAATCTQKDGKTHIRFLAEDIPAFGRKKYTASAAREEMPPNAADKTQMENEFLRVRFDANGNIVSLFDKLHGREVLAAGEASNLLTIFEDIPHRESAWNIDLEYQLQSWPLEKAESVELVEASALRAVLRVTRRFNLSTIRQDIILRRGARRLDFETTVDWQETERMLKTAFTVDILSPKATYEIQFGAIERPTHWNTSYDKARFEVCGHKWADLSEGGYGVSLLNDCKYGYDIKENRMRLTLLRSPNYPDPVADKGQHSFVYSLYPHAGDWREGGTVREAFAVNEPLYARAAEGNASAAEISEPFASVDAGHVVLDTIKRAEDGEGLVLRLYEANGARGPVALRLREKAEKAWLCNLMEDKEEALAVDGDALRFPIKPFEIITLRVITQ